ncbi:hypothetical protein [Fibrella arboris]|uniref:hypothetical protein n=1 Tax=Fibrella arboris TaxID=3242486 RepID=UPI00351FD44D
MVINVQIMGAEPTGNLDKASTDNVFSIFRELPSGRQTNVAVTHAPIVPPVPTVSLTCWAGSSFTDSYFIP